MHIFCLTLFTYILMLNNALADPPVKNPLIENPIEWNYTEQGKWPAKYCLDGRQQSPINILTLFTRRAKKTDPLQYNEKVGEKLKAKIRNEDYTVAVYLDDISTKAEISGAGLNGSYTFLQFHFQWPAEHTIDYIRWPLEISVLFYASKYGNPKDAISHEDGYVVVTSFYEIIPKSNPIFDNLLASIPEIASRMDGDSVPLKKEIVISDFLPPKNATRYYSYFGSVPKPYCEEIVTYRVFPKPSFISASQFNALINITDKKNQPVRFNNRNLQLLNGRRVLKSDNR